ncbi:hypothetical protein GCM10025883_07040 [Mobilicoccus caccae]|uniref:Uncharacterized protein n=1 Tax=Mobilicoccus caccae TaxID=1859295 RepID=A0ABQ6IMK9_9MICO|nr:hypothetical protein GCM10025883_07040 [Mobilicoccus caccae]
MNDLDPGRHPQPEEGSGGHMAEHGLWAEPGGIGDAPGSQHRGTSAPALQLSKAVYGQVRTVFDADDFSGSVFGEEVERVVIPTQHDLGTGQIKGRGDGGVPLE